MPRVAKLGTKNGYWYSEAGGSARYFGRVDTVAHAEATKRFRTALGTPKPTKEPTPTPTVTELTTLFLAWLKRHRGVRTHEERSRHLLRFAKANGKRRASEITGSHLECFLSTVASPDYAHKHEVSVRAMFRWGVKHGQLPNGFAPFATVEPVRPPAKALLESDLPTASEVESIIANAVPSLADVLRVQYATGARSGELLSASVGDYQP